MNAFSSILAWLIVIGSIVGVVSLIKARPSRKKSGGFSWAKVEAEFYDLLQTNIFEMLAAGYAQGSVPELATNKTADTIMRKYGISMPDMVKFIERTAKNHR